MTMTDLMPILPLIMSAAALFATVVMAIVSVVARRRLNQAKVEHEQQLAQLQKKLKLTTNSAVGIGQRILVLEEKIQRLQSRAEIAESNDGALAYTQAMQLFEQGVDTDTVATSCGLSSAEVSLMAMIHKQKSEAA